MTPGRDLAARTVRGVVAGMVVTVAAATAVGFWLSYSGLHDFAFRAGLTGPEGWAWPASVDLFIAAGEAGVTISALRSRRDKLAWAYLALGFAASVTGNVMHVYAGQLGWGRYAVAAVPPVAAMLALAALLRQIYQLAVEAHLRTAPEAHPESAPESALAPALTSAPEAHPGAPALNGRPHPTRTRTSERAPGAPVSGHDAEAEFMAELAAGTLPSLRSIRARMHVGQDRARALREHLKSVLIDA